MKPEDKTAGELERALRILAEHDRLAEAPAELEWRVVAEYRRVQRRRMVWRGVWSAAAAAAVAVALMIPRGEPVTVADEPVFEPADVAITLEPPEPVVEVQPAPVPAVARQESPREVVTEFFPLMDVMPPMERAEVWRVTVPASTMRVVGLPVSRERWEDGIQADVLVGEEGMARAIRFVSYEY